MAQNQARDLVQKSYQERNSIFPRETELHPNFFEILKLFQPKPEGRLLDIGCFNGQKTVLINQVVRAKTLYGTDFLEDRLNDARACGIEAHFADLNKEKLLPFPDSFFSVVVCTDVIEHIFSPDFLLMEIYRVLKPEGYAVLTTPNLASWRNRLVLLLGWQPFGTEVSTTQRLGNPLAFGGIVSGHLRLFVPRALRELLQLYKLQVELMVGLNASYANKPTLMGRLDQTLSRLNPGLADEIAIRFRKIA